MTQKVMSSDACVLCGGPQRARYHLGSHRLLYCPRCELGQLSPLPTDAELQALYASEENRPAILGICAAVFLLAGIGGGAYIFLAAKKRHPILKETIAVLKGDEQALHRSLQGAGDD